MPATRGGKGTVGVRLELLGLRLVDGGRDVEALDAQLLLVEEDAGLFNLWQSAKDSMTGR